jgi:putative transcriptional regulator
MSLRKLCFYALLAAILVGAAARLNRHRQQFAVHETNPANDPSLASNVSAKSHVLPADSLPLQSNNANSLGPGKLLVASRNLGDPNFAKTVILLARYDDHGVLGLILNRRTDVPLSRVLETLKAAKDRSDPVYVGGPLEMPAVFGLMQSPGKLEGAEHVFDGVYLIAEKSLFEQTISARPDHGVFHVYLGYAGWTPDQLRLEVKLGAWFVFPAETSTVFNANPDSLWLEMIRKTEQQLVRNEPELVRNEPGDPTGALFIPNRADLNALSFRTGPKAR